MPVDINDVREYVAIKSIPGVSHVGLKITARCSTPVYTCESPCRQYVAKDNYERRNHQINSCGYRSVNYKPYKEVGEVVLDEKELILKSLGQFQEGNYEENDEKEGHENQQRRASNKVSDEKDLITIPQPKIENMQKLEDHLSKGRRLMNKVKLGIGLFKLIKEEQNRKEIEAELERIRFEMESKTSMRPHDPNFDFDDESEDFDLSRFLAPTPSRSRVGYAWNGDGNEINHRHKQTPEGGRECSVDSNLEWKGDPTGNEKSEKASVDINENILIRKEDSEDHLRTSSKEPPLDEKKDKHNDLFYQHNGNGNVARTKIHRSKKYQNAMPRPFSPIFTNVNFYETESREYTFRQLCALHWILEAMSQDQTVSMPPISACWKLKDLKQELHRAQWKVDRDKAVDPIWKAFLSNPKKFTRSKPGGRGALLQRRISIAPNAIHRMSVASGGSQNLGSKLQSPSEESVSSISNSENKQEHRARSFSRLSSLLKKDNDSPEHGRRSQVKKPTLVQLAEDISMEQVPVPGPSLREKAFIVREVIVSKNAFGRRGSKINKGRTSSFTQTAKSHQEKPKRSKKKQTVSKLQKGTSTLIEEDSKKSNKFIEEGLSKRRKTLADIDSSSLDEIHSIRGFENLPVKLKETFEELAAEKAFVLHDNLEQREKTSVMSMERKFHSLHVMSDVNKAIGIMRSKSRLKVETEEEKKARYSEECSWYKSLLDNLPLGIREDRNNALVLDKIAKYGSLEGRKVSSTQFIKVLSLLRPWELCYPDISAAIEFVRDKIVEMDRTEFETWFQSRLSEAP